MKKTVAKREALKLFTEKGLKLGNYYYNVVRYIDNGKVEIYLTRWQSECEDCEHYDECQGDRPWAYEKPQCDNMLPIDPYAETYDFMGDYDGDSLYDYLSFYYDEFTAVERTAIKLIEEDPELLNIMEK